MPALFGKSFPCELYAKQACKMLPLYLCCVSKAKDQGRFAVHHLSYMAVSGLSCVDVWLDPAMHHNTLQGTLWSHQIAAYS